MELFLTLLLWLHFMGLAAGLGGGIALSQTGPRLMTASDHERPLVWKLERAFSAIASAGVALLLVSGPLLVWLKYGGFEAMPPWFWVKMVLVVIALPASRLMKSLLAGSRPAGRMPTGGWRSPGAPLE